MESEWQLEPQQHQCLMVSLEALTNRSSTLDHRNNKQPISLSTVLRQAEVKWPYKKIQSCLESEFCHEVESCHFLCRDKIGLMMKSMLNYFWHDHKWATYLERVQHVIDRTRAFLSLSVSIKKGMSLGRCCSMPFMHPKYKLITYISCNTKKSPTTD